MTDATLEHGGLVATYEDARPPVAPPPGASAAIDLTLADLRAHARHWARCTPEARGALLEQVVSGLAAIGPRLVTASLRANGLSADSHAEGEQWIAHAISIRLARLLQRSLADIARFGHPHLPHPPATRHTGQTVVHVYPDDMYEEVVLLGARAEVWMQPGIDLEETLASQAWSYRTPQSGALAAVLGAGNSSHLVAADILYRLFIEGRVVAYKFSPHNAYLAPLIAEAFAPLIRGGFLRLLTGGAAEGAYLADHPLVDTLHLTGSAATYNELVFGYGEEGEQRRAAGQQLIHKPMTAALGNVGPVIIVPGPWTAAELRTQAIALATAAVFGGGCLCATPRVIIQQRQWPERRAFFEDLAQVLGATSPRPPTHPGVYAIQAAVMARHPDTWSLGAVTPDTVPWLLIPDIDPDAEDEPCFTEELFGPVLAETALDAEDTADFIRQAVAFTNSRLWGTLAATLIIHPETLRDPQVRSAYEQALAELAYGVITVNTYPINAYYAGLTTWGAFPGSTPGDIQSGSGVTCNAAMLQHAEKSVLTAPFRPVVTPFMLDSHGMPLVARRLAEVQAHPSPLTVARMTLAPLGG
jgi:acyl-CoA reductase-like NAD-dependent aldehyde dehydrogenase